eukprot:SAG22_NODE_96_length_20771_cov_33.186018_16_plen_69_part_00
MTWPARVARLHGALGWMDTRELHLDALAFRTDLHMRYRLEPLVDTVPPVTCPGCKAAIPGRHIDMLFH